MQQTKTSWLNNQQKLATNLIALISEYIFLSLRKPVRHWLNIAIRLEHQLSSNCIEHLPGADPLNNSNSGCEDNNKHTECTGKEQQSSISCESGTESRTDEPEDHPDDLSLDAPPEYEGQDRDDVPEDHAGFDEESFWNVEEDKELYR